jgi:cytochrome c biogenesis protein
MTKPQNSVWRFFASVKLALIVLIILAVASIIGTVIEQRRASDYYIEEYGPEVARLMHILGLPDMYASWWFIALLTLFAVNLVVCSIERLPAVWRLMTLDNLAADPTQLEKQGSTYRADSKLPAAAAADRIRGYLIEAGWKNPRRRDQEGTALLFSQDGAWSRLGVYAVHLSILVILAGAMIGKVFGYKAYVFLPEGRATSNVFLQGSAQPVPLGFELYCDEFRTEYYPNGMVRQYSSDLTVIDPKRPEPYHKSIIINDPLTYKGITFYQGDSYPLEEYFVVIRNQTTGREQAFRVPAERDVPWQGTGVSFRIDELVNDDKGAVRQAKILLTDGDSEPAPLLMQNRGNVAFAGAEGNYSLSFHQLYSTLLLVTRDPGVWIVYLGCFLMVGGLAVCFLFAHRRIWVHISPGEKQGSRILLSGSSNKNRPAFERRFQELVTLMEKKAAIDAPPPSPVPMRKRAKKAAQT